MNSCAELLVAGLLEKANSRAVIDPRVTYIINCRHFGCYTMDVIASTAFGIVTNAFNNPDDPFVPAHYDSNHKPASRVDLLQLMLNAELQDDENESKATKRLSVEELTGQMLIVIVAGYETTASLLQYVAYVLTTNPDVQDKLLTQIDNCISEDVSELMYDVIQDMPYLDQVINETLRMYPPLA
ncbi:CP3A2-like protein, partial [Mya arenaria]